MPRVNNSTYIIVVFLKETLRHGGTQDFFKLWIKLRYNTWCGYGWVEPSVGINDYQVSVSVKYCFSFLFSETMCSKTKGSKTFLRKVLYNNHSCWWNWLMNWGGTRVLGKNPLFFFSPCFFSLHFWREDYRPIETISKASPVHVKSS